MRPVDLAKAPIPDSMLPPEVTERKTDTNYVPRLDMDQLEMDGADEEDSEILEFVSAVCNDDDPLRRSYLFDCARNLRMFRGLQWFDEAQSYRLTESTNGYAFEYLARGDFGDDRPLPLPQTNLIAEAVANETNRLGRKEYQPSISSKGAKPETQQAAQLAQKVVGFNMTEMGWDDVRREIEAEFVLCGMAVGKSYVDEILTEGEVKMSADCHLCDECRCVSASKVTPDGSILEACPSCGGPMRRVEMPEDTDMVDFYGRPVARLEPTVKPMIAHVPNAEMFYENGGVRVSPRTCRIFGQASAVDLDSIMERWPSTAEWLEPEPAEQILRHDLVLGDMLRLASAQGKTIYPHHARLFEVHVLPRLNLPKGASFYVCQGKVLGAKKLVKDFESGGRKHSIQLVRYGVARMRSVPGVMYGRTPVSDCVPLNRRYNFIDLIEEEIQHKGYPVLIHPPGVTFTVRREGPFAVCEVESADDNTPQRNLKDMMIATPAQTGAEYEAIKAGLEQKIQKLMGPAPIEGTGAMGPQTATGLQLMVEQREQARGPYEARLKDGIFTPLWAHHLGLLAAFDTEGEATIEQGASSYAVKSYRGSDLGVTGVDFSLDSKGNFDRTLFQREGVTQGLQLGIYDMTDDATKDKIRDAMGLPEIPSSKSDQIKIAEEAWQEWIEDAGESFGEAEETEEVPEEGAEETAGPMVPTFDPITNDPMVWFSVLGKAWIGEDCRRILSKTQWSLFLPMIAGWPDRLAQAEEIDAQQRAVYGGVQPEQWEAHYEQAKQQALRQSQEAQAAQQAATGVPAPPPEAAQVPPPPQTGTFLPDPMEERLMFVWAQMCGGQVPQSVALVLPMYALICACWTRGKKAAEAQGMMAAPVAPGQQGGAA